MRLTTGGIVMQTPSESKSIDFINELDRYIAEQELKTSDPELKTTLADLPNYNILTWSERLKYDVKEFNYVMAANWDRELTARASNRHLNDYLATLNYFKKLIQDLNENKINTKALQQIKDAFVKENKEGNNALSLLISIYNISPAEMPRPVIVKMLANLIKNKIITREQIQEQYLKLTGTKVSTSLEKKEEVYPTDFDQDFKLDDTDLKAEGIKLPNLDVLAWAQAIYSNGDRTAISNFKQLLQDINDNKIDIIKVREAFDNVSEAGVAAVWYLANPKGENSSDVFTLLRHFVNKNVITKDQFHSKTKEGVRVFDQLYTFKAYRNIYFLLQRGFPAYVYNKYYAEKQDAQKFNLSNLNEMIHSPERLRLIIVLLQREMKYSENNKIGDIGNFLIDYFTRDNFKINMQSEQVTYDKEHYLGKRQVETHDITQIYSVALAINILLPPESHAKNPFISAFFRSFEKAMIENIALLRDWPINKEMSERPDNTGVKSLNKTIFIKKILPDCLPNYAAPIANAKFFNKYVNDVLFPKVEKYILKMSIKLFVMKITPRFKEAVRAINWVLYNSEFEKNFIEIVEGSLHKYFTANPLSQIRGMAQEKIIQQILQCVQDDCKEPGKPNNALIKNFDSIIANNAYNPVAAAKETAFQAKQRLFERGEQTTEQSINQDDKKSDKGMGL